MRQEFHKADYPEKDDPNARFKLDDMTYLRFLRARDFNVKNSKAMLQDHLNFRAKWKPESISLLQDLKLREIVERDGGYWRFAGFSKSGCPIQLVNIGKYKPEYFPDVETYTRVIIYQNEQIRKYFHANGYKVDKNLVFYDLVSHTHWLKSFFKRKRCK
jgi:hypothetical protein